MKEMNITTPQAKNWINEESLKKAGFEKRINMWNRGGIWLQLVNGHTWMAEHKTLPRSIEVRTIDDIEAIGK